MSRFGRMVSLPSWAWRGEGKFRGVKLLGETAAVPPPTGDGPRLTSMSAGERGPEGERMARCWVHTGDGGEKN